MPTDLCAIIPARYDSTRFPGKVLAAETGRPLIQHVHDRAIAALCISRVIVATDDQRIAGAVRDFGGEVAMTRSDHPNGTSRIAEAAAGLDAQILVNIQGDQPEIDPALIDLAVDNLIARPDCPMGTVAAPFAADEDPADPNIVKVVLDQRGRALYFSRAAIGSRLSARAVAPSHEGGCGPHSRRAADGDPGQRMGETCSLSPRDPVPPGAAPGGSPLPGTKGEQSRQTTAAFKHIGLYVYRREFLLEYAALPPTPLEQAERLEQLRALEHGHRIAVAVAPRPVASHGIDTPEQYAAFVQRHRAAAGGSR